MIIDRLFDEVNKKGFVCLGLDTHIDYITCSIKDKYDNIEDKMFYFNKAIIDATKDVVSIFKLQIAYYESNGIAGLKAYKRTLKYLKEQGILSIGDIKRSDIVQTAKEYAKAHFEGDFETDFITINPYMGMDSIEPYLQYLESGQKGIFVLLRTSNEGARDVECLMHNNEEVYFYIGDKLQNLAKKYIGRCGYSSLSLVVGATHSDEAEKIRDRYSNQFFLLPGYGAQGAKSSDIRKYLRDFNGGVVNSSRGIITNWKKFEDGDTNFANYARMAVLDMKRDIYGE